MSSSRAKQVQYTIGCYIVLVFLFSRFLDRLSQKFRRKLKKSAPSFAAFPGVARAGWPCTQSKKCYNFIFYQRRIPYTTASIIIDLTYSIAHISFDQHWLGFTSFTIRLSFLLLLLHVRILLNLFHIRQP